jgi:hypothetical protein
VAESFGEVEPSATLVVEFNRVPLAEGGGSNSDVYDYVQDLSVEALNVLGLPGRNVCKMDTADGSLLRHRDVHLLEIERAACRFVKGGSFEGLQEYTPIIRTQEW